MSWKLFLFEQSVTINNKALLRSNVSVSHSVTLVCLWVESENKNVPYGDEDKEVGVMCDKPDKSDL